MKRKTGFFRSLFGAKIGKCDEGTRNETNTQPSIPITSNTLDSEVHGHQPTHTRLLFPSASQEGIMEGYLTKRGGSAQKYLNFHSEPWERCYFTLTSAGTLYIYKNRLEYRNGPKNHTLTQPLRLSEYYVEVCNLDDELRSENVINAGRSKSDSVFPKRLLAIPDDSDIKPYRFQMTLVLRKHVDDLVQVDESGYTTRIVPSKQSRYRDHWVLRCDTEEELLQWVQAMQDLCPSSFEAT